jgi:hypothetical protein
MTLVNCYYYFGLCLIIHARYLSAYKCHECDGMIFNSTLTIDNLPRPDRDDCIEVTAESSCFVRIGWFGNGITEVYYSADSSLPIDSVVVITERKVTTWSGEYVTHRFIGYSCKASNTTPCNTVENLKRAILSTTFSTNEEIQKFDALIVPTTDFDGSLCSEYTNATDCPTTNLASCQQCMAIVQYSDQINTCTMCPAGKAITNFIDYYSTFLLNNRTRLDMIRLGCRKHGACNSIENIEQVKNTLITKFDFKNFDNSTASISKLSKLILFIMIIIRLN